MAIDVERHLLLGLLALQTGLIDQGALFTAFNAWSRDRSRPLADVLIALGHLDTARRALLEGLVAEHLKLHGGDVERSLAAVPAGRSTREGLAAITDPSLQATVLKLSPGTTEAGVSADRPAPYGVGTATSDGRRFRVLRPHARGGLGVVFVALDDELHREVALKQIQDSHADDPASRQRFLLEAEITGGLEHPGIVPVYGLGTYDDGRPFYAMRFIRGDSLKGAIDRFHKDEALKSDPGRRSLELRKLLRRLVDVCNAIDYAHGRGVLHRDLKPGNVIVGKHGETLVVDWGLAKPTGRSEESPDTGERTLQPLSAGGSAETLPGSALGTPAYMSPEQAAGELDRLGPRSDVYSLGATLYCLLTGRPPFEGEALGPLLRDVRQGRFAPPRAVDPAIAPALEAICLRAMATRIEDRYASCRALADDVERWSADEPVAAYREPMTARLGRWGRRHLALLGGAAGLLVTATAALAIGLVLVGRANEEAERQRSRAVLSAERAEGNLRLAREAVDRYFTQVSEDRLLDEPHMEGLRKELLLTARDFYERFVSERAGDPKVGADLGVAYLRLLRIARATGAYGEAIEHGTRARNILADLVARDPDAIEARRSLGGCLGDLGRLHSDTGRLDEAEPLLRGARTIRDGLVASPHATAEDRLKLADTLVDLGYFHVTRGQDQEAKASYRRSIALSGALTRQHPGRPEYWAALGWAHLLLGRVSEGDSLTAAEGHYRESLRAWQALIELEPLSVRTRNNLGYGLVNLGEILARTGRMRDAEPLLKRAVAIREKLVAEHPDVPSLAVDLGIAINTLGRFHLRNGDETRARAEMERALEMTRRGLSRVPEEGRFLTEFMRVVDGLSDFLARTGRSAEALATRLRVVEFLEPHRRSYPGNAHLRFNLGRNHLIIGQLIEQQGEVRGACDWYGLAIEALEGTMDTLPRRAGPPLARALTLRAVAALNLGEDGPALADLERALVLSDEAERGNLRLLRAVALARRGDHARALSEAEALVGNGTIPPALRAYNLACVQAQAASAIRRDHHLDPADREARADRAAARALELLERARSLGFFRHPTARLEMRGDRDLEPLHARADFLAWYAALLDEGFPRNPFASP